MLDCKQRQSCRCIKLEETLNRKLQLKPAYETQSTVFCHRGLFWRGSLKQGVLKFLNVSGVSADSIENNAFSWESWIEAHGLCLNPGAQG